MKKSYSKVKWFLIAFLILVIEQLPLLFLKKNQALWEVALLGLTLVIITLATLIFDKKQDIIGKAKATDQESPLLWIGIGFAAMTAFKMVGAMVLYLEHGANANTANQQLLEQAGIHPILLFILAVIVAPVVEETIFRGILYQKMFGLESIFGLALSSVLFGLLHGPTDLGSWIIYAGMGLSLGLVFMKTKKLEYSMLLHFINNGVAVLLMFFMTK